jgi:Probable taurine catabolism dioxygenase
MALTFKPLSAGIGVEVIGVDFSRPLDEASVAQIQRAWDEHCVILFRNANITNKQQVEFSRNFGPLDNHDLIARLRDPENPEILPVTPQQEGGRTLVVGRQWHTDMSCTETPPKGSLLRCEVVPDIGGDTMFSNMYLAYDALSDTMKKLLEGLEAIHDLRVAKHNRGQDPATVLARTPPVAHPIVRVHPGSGRKALYISEMTCAGIVGMKYEESKPILEYLFQHCVQPEFTYRHSWSVGDMIGWDNRSTIHLALADYDFKAPRKLYRTTLLGEKVGRVLPVDAVPQFNYDPRA